MHDHVKIYPVIGNKINPVYMSVCKTEKGKEVLGNYEVFHLVKQAYTYGGLIPLIF